MPALLLRYALLAVAVAAINFAMLLLLVLALGLGWFPLQGGLTTFAPPGQTWLDSALDRLSHLALPALTLVVANLAGFALLSRGAVRDVLRQPYLATARAKGLAEWRVALLHAAPNALLPVFTLFGARLGGVLGGSGVLLAATDLLLALPSIPLLLLVVTLVGPSQVHLVVALGVLSWPVFARVVRARLLVVTNATYVEAARAVGGSEVHIALRYLAPATLELLPAKLALTVRFAMFAEATLAFLGLGDPTARSWGTMLGWAFNDPLIFVSGAWTWWVVPPALAIVVAVLGVTWLAPGPDSDTCLRHVNGAY